MHKFAINEAYDKRAMPPLFVLQEAEELLEYCKHGVV